MNEQLQEDKQVEYTVVGADGKEYGPMDLETLKDMVRDERVDGDTRVWDSTTKDWHEARQIEELEEFFPETLEEETVMPPPLTAGDAPQSVTSPWAVASIACGIVSLPLFFCGGWVLGSLAVTFGALGRNETRQYGYEGSHLATAGIVCGLVTLGLSLVIGLAFGPFFFDVLKRMIAEYRP